MKGIILILHIAIALLLSLLILLQRSKGGLGSGFGDFTHYRTKRGAERAVFGATIVLAILFLATSIANVLIP